MKVRVRIGIVEDHDMVREGLVRLLADEVKLKVVFAVANGKELLSKLQNLVPEILLLDMELPDIHGSKILELLTAKYTELKVIVISAYNDEDLVVKYVKQGAVSFIPKYSNSKTLIDGIFAVQKDGYFFEEPLHKLLTRRVALPNLEKPLSRSEQKVITLICEGKDMKDIVNETGYSLTFAYSLRKRIFLKTGTSTVEELKSYADRFRYFGE